MNSRVDIHTETKKKDCSTLCLQTAKDPCRSVLRQIPVFVVLCECGILECYRSDGLRPAVTVAFRGEKIGSFLLSDDEKRDTERPCVVFI